MFSISCSQSHFIAKATARRRAWSGDWEIFPKSLSTRISPRCALTRCRRWNDGARLPRWLQELSWEILRHVAAIRRYSAKHQSNAGAERWRCKCASAVHRTRRTDRGRDGKPPDRCAEQQVSARASQNELLCFVQGTQFPSFETVLRLLLQCSEVSFAFLTFTLSPALAPLTKINDQLFFVCLSLTHFHRGCLTQFLGGLDTDWTSFSEAITNLLLTVRNKDGIETVIKNLDGKLSEAIMHAMTNGPDLEKKVSHGRNNLYWGLRTTTCLLKHLSIFLPFRIVWLMSWVEKVA